MTQTMVSKSAPTGQPKYTSPHKRAETAPPSSPASSPPKSWSSMTPWSLGSRQLPRTPPSTPPQSPLPSPPSTPPGSRRGAFSSANWRVSAGPPPSYKPSFDDLRPGQVFHLPDQAQIPSGSIFFQTMATRSDAPYDHPVVVLSKDAVNQIVRFRTLTSFGGKGVAAKLPHERRLIALCADEASTLPHIGTRKLEVEPGSPRFTKPTYINFYEAESFCGEFEIEYAYLQHWATHNNKPITFDAESLNRIQNRQAC